ncbi:MAG TPA: amino acid adenylation domain-containing protein, partial [Blastocatellia bacterium]|nr:amino acid adenylation domain-containing protein [Blastocatellia bacterium]
SGELRRLSRRQGVTLFMTLLTGYRALLSRYSGQAEVVVGTPVAGRQQAEVEGLIGFFVNMVVLRGSLEGDPSVEEMLRREREVTLGAYGHQEVGFERLVEELQPEREMSRAPLFQAMFVLQNVRRERLRLAGLKLNQEAVEVETAHYELSLAMSEGEEGLEGTVSYSRDLYEAETVRRMVRHYERVLGEMVAGEGRRLSEMEMLEEGERQQLLVGWNDTDRCYAPAHSIQQLVEQAVANHPERVALLCHDQHLTYGELNRRANRLAHYLRRQGVGLESLVGVLMPRSPELLVALLGVLKAGAAYVPLDPTYPRQRLQLILDDAQIKLLLTQVPVADELATLAASARLIDVNEACQQVPAASATDPQIEVAGSNLAYLIYTSGSTGRPKGVAIQQQNAVTFMQWAAEVFSQQVMEVVLASTSICFDLSIFELFVTLSRGGKVILTGNALELAEMNPPEAVTLINTVPSAMQELLKLQAVPESVRVVNLAGEALSRELVEQVYALSHVEELYNLYGPSEDTTYSTYGLMSRATGQRVPIGRPIANTRAYILDERLRPSAIGVAGELYLAGAGLARGYYGRAELTAERFVPNPFARQAGERMYLTGDVCRWRADGEIEYVGRADHQVKVRGFRIELGEIESALRSQPGIAEAAVVVREDRQGDKRLVAYLVRKQAHGPSSAELRNYLQGKLPAYMMPSAFVFLEQMPQTDNGKLNRRALPAVSLDEGDEGDQHVAPRNPTEEMIAGIWADVLGLEQVSVTADFFVLGGHSLKATQIIARARNAFHINLPVSAIFEAPTVARLAQAIEKHLQEQQGTNAPPLTRINRETRIPLSFAQHRLWFLEQMEPGKATYNVPFAIRLSGNLRIPALESSLNQIICRHEALRTRIDMADGTPSQVIAAPAEVAIPLISLKQISPELREDAARRIIGRLASRPLDINRGPLFQAVLIQLDDADHVLMLIAHHVIFDGWSYGVLLRELATFYKGCMAGETPRLSELAIQYADYAHWQRQWLKGETLDQHLAYWKRQLGGVSRLNLPTDHAPTTTPMAPIASHKLMLPKSLADDLKAISRREGVTLFMTLLTAFQILLYRWTGQEDVAVGTVIAGRDRQEVEGLIGFFVNTLVMRTDLSGNPAFSESLARVRKVALEAYAHQDVPFEKIVQALRPKRDAGHHPLFQVMFSLDRPQLNQLEMADLKVNRMRFSTGEAKMAKFDLTLAIADAEQGLVVTLSYKKDLFEAATIQELAQNLETLLGGIAAHPDRG